VSSKEAAQTDRLTLVIAANAEEYHSWRRSSGKGRSSQYVAGPEWLYGWPRVDIEILTIPIWWTQEDQEQLEAIMERSNA
jgi:hypothetical protein